MKLGLVTFILIFAGLVSAKPTLTVEPEKRLFFDPLTLIVSGLEQGSMVYIEASYPGSKGGVYRSNATYFADETGTVDVSTSYSSGGTYEGVEPFGLIWSAIKEETTASSNKQTELKDIEITYNATVVSHMHPDKSITLTAKQTNSYQADDIINEEINEGELRGLLSYPKGKTSLPTVVLMAGSDGSVYAEDASLLASRGFAVLALASHNYAGRPEALMRIPLEYWFDGINYMRNRFDDKRVALMGASRGGELALLLASTWPELVDAVVSIAPSNVIWSGCCTPQAFSSPAFTLNGEDVLPTGYPPQMAMIDPDKSKMYQYSEREYYIQSMLSPEKYGSVIKVEKIDAPIMIVAGGADRLWPSEVAARMISKRLKANNFSHELKVRIFPGAGHVAGAALHNTTGSVDWADPQNPAIRFPLGGTVVGNAHATHISRAEQVEFLRKYTKN